MVLKCYNYDIVCQEVPGEISLALNISGCPNHCKGCHSPWLWKDEGVIIDERFLGLLINKYSSAITCICFMGGDRDTAEINNLAEFIKKNYKSIKVAWYSGLELIPKSVNLLFFDYIKIGPYIEEKGGLDSKTTNQKFFKVLSDGSLEHLPFYK